MGPGERAKHDQLSKELADSWSGPLFTLFTGLVREGFSEANAMTLVNTWFSTNLILANQRNLDEE